MFVDDSYIVTLQT